MFMPEMKTYCRDIMSCGNPKEHIQTLMTMYPHAPEYQTELMPCRSESVLYKCNLNS
jgi:hypothetical protein